jgi:hypothetical protein
MADVPLERTNSQGSKRPGGPSTSPKVANLTGSPTGDPAVCLVIADGGGADSCTPIGIV